MAAIARHWSPAFHGAQRDEKRFAAEIARLVRDAQAAAKSSARSTARSGAKSHAEPVAALRRVRAALAAEGRLCMVVWRKREDNPFAHLAELSVRRLLPELGGAGERAPTCGPGPFSMANADVVTDVLLSAGFRDVGLERHDAPIAIGRDLDEAVDFALELGPAGELLRLHGSEGARLRPALSASLRDAFRPFATEAGAYLESSAWLVTARA